MKRDVMRITPIAEPGRSAVLDLALECGHRVLRFDPGPSWARLRPVEADCHKCDRSAALDQAGARRAV